MMKRNIFFRAPKLITVFFSCGIAMLWRYHSVVTMRFPSAKEGLIYRFPFKGGYRFLNSVDINSLVLSVFLFIFAGILLIFNVLVKTYYRSDLAEDPFKGLNILLFFAITALISTIIGFSTFQIGCMLSELHIVLSLFS